MNVTWTNEAEGSFNGIIDFLLAQWTSEEAHTFIDMIEAIIKQIQSNPEMFKVPEYDNQSREALITKHTTMFYRIYNQRIEIEYFRGNYQDSKKLKYLLGK